jgi:hypothetical protein
MYTVIRNHINTFDFMLGCLKEEEKNDDMIVQGG